MITRSLLLLIMLIILIVPPCSALATEPVKECKLSSKPELSFPLPGWLTQVQRGYLGEICVLMVRRVGDEAGKSMEVERYEALLKGEGECAGKICREEVQVDKELVELDAAHTHKLLGLLREHLASPPFKEEAFWTAWQSERRRSETEIDPFIEKQLYFKAKRILRKKELKEQ